MSCSFSLLVNMDPPFLRSSSCLICPGPVPSVSHCSGPVKETVADAHSSQLLPNSVLFPVETSGDPLLPQKARKTHHSSSMTPPDVLQSNAHPCLVSSAFKLGSSQTAWLPHGPTFVVFCSALLIATGTRKRLHYNSKPPSFFLSPVRKPEHSQRRISRPVRLAGLAVVALDLAEHASELFGNGWVWAT